MRALVVALLVLRGSASHAGPSCYSLADLAGYYTAGRDHAELLPGKRTLVGIYYLKIPGGSAYGRFEVATQPGLPGKPCNRITGTYSESDSTDTETTGTIDVFGTTNGIVLEMTPKGSTVTHRWIGAIRR